MIAVPANALETTMACRVFREIKLGLYLASGSDIVTTGTSLSRPPPAPLRSYLHFPPSDPDSRGVRAGKKSESYELSKISAAPTVVRVNTETFIVRDGDGRRHSDKEYNTHLGVNAV